MFFVSLCGGGRHKGAADGKSRGGGRNPHSGTEGAGCSLQPLRHSLCCRESQLKAQSGLRPVVLAQERSGRLFCRRVNYSSIPTHIRKRYQRVDNSSSMGAKRLEWQRSVQGGHRLLQQEQEQEQDRGDQRQDRTVEPRLRRVRAGSQGSQGNGKGRDAELSACKPAEGAVAGNVTAASARYRMVTTEEDIESMHRTKSVQVWHSTRGLPDLIRTSRVIYYRINTPVFDGEELGYLE